MSAPLDSISSCGLTYDHIEDGRPGMSVTELRQARQASWRAFQDDPDILYYLGEFYRRRVDPGAHGLDPSGGLRPLG